MPPSRDHSTDSDTPSLLQQQQQQKAAASSRKTKLAASAAPKRRGVHKNVTFKFRSSMYVGRRKANTITEHYELGDELNEGAYGIVYKAIHLESGAERAVKKIEKSRWNAEENQKVMDEFEVLRRLDHPNILKMYELFEDDSHFYIITDICKGGDLLDELETLEENGAFSERDAALLMNQVLSSINYCHKNNLVHRDLKPENILLEQNKDLYQIKLIDFGFAVPCRDDQHMQEQKGTAAYMSPQAMREEPYGQKTDVWAVGVIAYIVLAGFNPFEGHTDQETAILVEMGEFDFDIPEWDHISDAAQDFVTACLEYDEEDRWTARQALDHPWIKHCRDSVHDDFYKSGTHECVAALHNLQKFNAQSKLKQATYTFIASQLLLKEEKESIDKLFRSMDTTSDGKLTKEEVQLGYQKIFGQTLSDDDVEELFQQVDMNGDGVLEYSEFVIAAMDAKNLLSNENLKKAFQMFDYDDDGCISREDLRQVLNFFKSEGQETVQDAVIDKIMNQVDTDGNGQIDFDEFVEIMFSTAALPELPATTAEEEGDHDDEEEEDGLLEEAAERAVAQPKDEAAADNVSTTSSKITAKSALQMPRRRSSAMEDISSDGGGGGELAKRLTRKPSGKGAKDYLDKFERNVIRTASGSSEISNLSVMSDDEEMEGGRMGGGVRKTLSTESGASGSNNKKGSMMVLPVTKHRKRQVERTKSGDQRIRQNSAGSGPKWSFNASFVQQQPSKSPTGAKATASSLEKMKASAKEKQKQQKEQKEAYGNFAWKGTTKADGAAAPLNMAIARNDDGGNKEQVEDGEPSQQEETTPPTTPAEKRMSIQDRMAALQITASNDSAASKKQVVEVPGPSIRDRMNAFANASLSAVNKIQELRKNRSADDSALEMEPEDPEMSQSMNAAEDIPRVRASAPITAKDASKLKDRMELFEQNIEKNKEKGKHKKVS